VFIVNAHLADAAQVVGGKHYVLGGGWSRIVPGAPFAVYGTVLIPWNLRTEAHTLQLELVDTDGRPFAPPGAPPLVFTFEYDPAVRQFDGIKPGTGIDWAFSATVGPLLPLTPNTRYEWRIGIDGHVEDGWTLPFQTLGDVGLRAA
jgi:hypothetical protein